MPDGRFRRSAGTFPASPLPIRKHEPIPAVRRFPPYLPARVPGAIRKPAPGSSASCCGGQGAGLADLSAQALLKDALAILGHHWRS